MKTVPFILKAKLWIEKKSVLKYFGIYTQSNMPNLKAIKLYNSIYQLFIFIFFY